MTLSSNVENPELDGITAARVDLRALVDEYAMASDTGDLDRFGALFTENGQFIAATPGSDEAVVLQGTEQVKYGPRGNQMFERTFHAVNNHVVEVTGDTASGTTYCTAHHLLRHGDDRLEVIVAPILYRDDYERTDAGWKFRRRELQWTWLERRPAQDPAPWW